MTTEDAMGTREVSLFRSVRATTLWAPLLAVVAGGCFDEHLPIYDLEGSLVVPREAATQTITVPLDADGNVITDPNAVPVSSEQRVVGPDVRLLGPVYVGLYASVVYDFQNYPYPEVGPAVNDYNKDGKQDQDTFPYGGTTVGDFRYACYEYFKCKMISGRFTDFDDIIQFFNTELESPITDVKGDVVTNGDEIRATCYELLAVTADSEVRITATKDRNDDGELDANDLDFVEMDDGNFVADFKIWQADYYDGMATWAWMDDPQIAVRGKQYAFSSCFDTNEDGNGVGYTEDTYDQRWFAGTARPDVFNAPYLLISDEDWVASHAAVWTSPWDRPEVKIDFNVGTSDIEPLRDEAALAAGGAP